MPNRLPVFTSTPVVDANVNTPYTYQARAVDPDGDSLKFTLQDYAYLDYDVAVLYDGYNDLRHANRRVFRRDSPVFRLTGYFPILPLVLDEKSRAIRYGGDLGERFGREDPVFRPGLGDKATSGALKAAAEVTRALERVLGPLTREPAARRTESAALTSCGEPFRRYCDNVSAGVEAGVKAGVGMDTVIGQHTGTPALEQTWRPEYGQAEPTIRFLLGRFVKMKGGEFFFAPSLPFLKGLS